MLGHEIQGVTPRQALTELAIRAARRELVPFVLFTFPGFAPAPHHKLIAEHLEAVERGDITRLMVLLPPRHSKSELVSRRFPAWYLGRNPNRQIICAAYNTDLASEFGRDVRDIVSDGRYRSVFKVGLRQDSKAAGRWLTSNGGSYLAAGVGAGITGYGAHLAVIDDPLKNRAEAESKTVRDGIWKWYTSSLYTRLMPGASIIVTLTRWHADDLAGRLLREQSQGGDQWTVLDLPALARDGDALGRAPGEALWPDWYSIDDLNRIRGAIGTDEFLSLYQQSPVEETGNLFKRQWWQYYRVPEKDYNKVIQSWDTGFQAGDKSDYSVGLTMGLTDANQVHIMDRVKDRLEFPALKRAIESAAARHKPEVILVESAASGQSIVQALRSETMLPIVPVTVSRTTGGKEARAKSVLGMVEGARVHLPEYGDWVQDFVSVCAAFPRGEHDDDVDALSQGLDYLRQDVAAAPVRMAPTFRPMFVNSGSGWLSN